MNIGTPVDRPLPDPQADPHDGSLRVPDVDARRPRLDQTHFAENDRLVGLGGADGDETGDRHVAVAIAEDRERLVGDREARVPAPPHPQHSAGRHRRDRGGDVGEVRSRPVVRVDDEGLCRYGTGEEGVRNRRDL